MRFVVSSLWLSYILSLKLSLLLEHIFKSIYEVVKVACTSTLLFIVNVKTSLQLIYVGIHI